MTEWKTYKLGDVVNILDNRRIPLSAREREQRHGEYPYYGAQGIIDYVDDYLFDSTYLLIAEDGENLRSKKQNIAQLVSGKYWVNNHAHILENNGLCDIRYICYLLNIIDISGYITGSAQPKLNQANLLAISISLPPLEEQRRIAGILGAIDDKIENNRRINDNLEQQAQALYKQWFVDNRKDDWEEKQLGEIALHITDGVHNTVIDSPNGEYYLLSCKNIKSGQLFIGSNERRIDHETFTKLRKRTRLSQGDILVTSVGTVGEMYLVNESPTNYEFQRSVAIIKPNQDIISSYFLYAALLYQRNEIKHLAHGAVQQCIFISDLKEYSLIVPNKDDISAFDEVVAPMFNKIGELQKENETLSILRDTLLPKLMNGEIKL